MEGRLVGRNGGALLQRRANYTRSESGVQCLGVHCPEPLLPTNFPMSKDCLPSLRTPVCRIRERFGDRNSMASAETKVSGGEGGIRVQIFRHVANVNGKLFIPYTYADSIQSRWTPQCPSVGPMLWLVNRSSRFGSGGRSRQQCRSDQSKTLILNVSSKGMLTTSLVSCELWVILT